MGRTNRAWQGVLTAAVAASFGCAQRATVPVLWDDDGSHVYLVGGATELPPIEIREIHDRLYAEHVACNMFRADDRQRIETDIDRAPHEKIILVGYGDGAIVCTQIAANLADRKNGRTVVGALFTIEPDCEVEAPAPRPCRLADRRECWPIDNDPAVVERIVRLCREEALSPFHYTPIEHHPNVETQAEPQRKGRPRATG